MTIAKTKDLQLAEQLAFHPRIWWDPLPPFLVDHVDKLTLVALAKVQLKHQANVLESQLAGLKESMKLLEGIR